MTDTTPMRERIARMLAANDPSCQFTAEACLDPATTIAPTSHYYQMVDALLDVLESPSEAAFDAAYRLVDHGAFVQRQTAIRHSIAAMVKAIRGGPNPCHHIDSLIKRAPASVVQSLRL